MATFMVGQRVRIIGPHESLFFGKEGIIWKVEPGNWSDRNLALGTDQNETAYCVVVDGIGAFTSCGDLIAFPSHWIAPLTDPGVDALMERLKKLAREPAPVIPQKVVQ